MSRELPSGTRAIGLKGKVSPAHEQKGALGEYVPTRSATQLLAAPQIKVDKSDLGTKARYGRQYCPGHEPSGWCLGLLRQLMAGLFFDLTMCIRKLEPCLTIGNK
uniref:Uncharacterized protein n=1 Tax=Trichuris muris TaxID=70415 RepID=A0A5S6QBL3_TRIMR